MAGSQRVVTNAGGSVVVHQGAYTTPSGGSATQTSSSSSTGRMQRLSMVANAVQAVHQQAAPAARATTPELPMPGHREAANIRSIVSGVRQAAVQAHAPHIARELHEEAAHLEQIETRLSAAIEALRSQRVIQREAFADALSGIMADLRSAATEIQTRGTL